MNGDVNDNYIVSSLVRGLKILSTFSFKRPNLKVTEIADITGFDQATVFRFVYTLEKLGYLVRDKDTKRYHQGVKMLSLSLPARQGIAVRDAAVQVMEELSSQENLATKIAVMDEGEVVVVGFSDVGNKLTYHTPIGTRLPVYCTALGKVLLAFQPIETWDLLISNIEFAPLTEQTITNPDLFKEELLKTRQRGYATQDSEQVIGLGGIGAPIFDHDGVVSGAICFSGLATELLGVEKTEHFIHELILGAESISAKMGFTSRIG